MSHKKRILIIGMASSLGGIEAFLINVYRRINRELMHFDFLTFFPKCAYEDELVESGSKVYHVTRRGKNPLKNKMELEAFFRAHKNDYDFIWYHASSSSNIVPIVIAKKYCSSKTIVHCHGTGFESTALARPIHLLFDKINFNKMKKNTDFCFACSKAAGKYLFKDKCGEVIVIKNGIVTADYKYNEQIREKVRTELGFGKDTVVIGHAGRLCAIKNQLFMLEVFEKYLRTNEDSRLVIAGDGEMKEELLTKVEALGVEEKVVFLGYRKDLNRLVQAFDVFMLPSFSEGFPVTLIEAQTAGLSCLVSNGVTEEAGITDLVTFKSLSDSAEEWACTLERVVKEKAFLRKEINYSNTVKDDGFDIVDTVEQIERFFIQN